MKISKVVLIALAFTAPALLHAQGQSTTPAQAKDENASEALKAVNTRKAELKSGVDTRLPLEKKTGLERHKLLSVIKGSHKIVIHPIKQSDGIKTGLVIAYGHVIPPPYTVEYVGEKLMINGVQISPSLVREREVVAQKKTHLVANKIDQAWKGAQIEYAAQKLYTSGLKTKSLEAVQGEISMLINKSTDVFQNPIWLGRKTLHVKLTGSGLLSSLQFSETPRVVEKEETTKRNAAERAEKSNASYLDLLRKQLEGGQTIVFLSNGCEVGGQGIHDQVNPIMKEMGLTRDQRIEKLHDAGVDYDFADDIVDNYDLNEWRAK
jgi:hypothetical protein